MMLLRVQVGAPSLPSSCMPVGMRPEDALTKLVTVWPSPALQHRLLAVSFASGPDDDVLHTNLAGFVCVLVLSFFSFIHNLAFQYTFDSKQKCIENPHFTLKIPPIYFLTFSWGIAFYQLFMELNDKINIPIRNDYL